ncbi:MAG: hypothetical protein PHW22_04560 [Bacilli bacterium]|nr:hypothetical protein [Bacilli bacterium]
MIESLTYVISLFLCIVFLSLQQYEIVIALLIPLAISGGTLFIKRSKEGSNNSVK